MATHATAYQPAYLDWLGSKADLLRRTQAVVVRLKGMRGIPTVAAVSVVADLERDLDALELQLARHIDDFMTNQIRKHCRPTPVCDVRGLSGMWNSRRT